MTTTTLLHLLRKILKNVGLGDVLSLSRGFLAVPVILAAVQRNWGLFAILVTVAWATDLFDGSAARRRGAKSLGKVFDGLNMDGINDSIIGFASTGALVWVAIRDTSTTTAVLASVLWVVTAIVCGYMAIVSMNVSNPNRFHCTIIAVSMIAIHSIVQISGVITLGLYLAFGFWPAYVAFLILCTITLANRGKVKLWMSGAV